MFKSGIFNGFRGWCNMKNILFQLEWILQVLSQEAEIQIQFYPDFVCIPDELALDFEHWSKRVMQNRKLSDKQKSSLEIIDKYFDEFKEDLWTLESLKSSDEWNNIRALARQSLSVFGWPVEIPSDNRSYYVKV